MASIDFPNAPSVNDVFTASGQSWVWNGVFWEAALTDQVVGPTGPAGVDGINGVNGATGPTGSSGGITFSITNSGSGAYIINGASNPALSVIRGHRYILNVNASGHPFWIQTVSGGYSSGNIYNTGITNNGAEVGQIIWEVPFNAPDTLYYACQYHSSMAGTINVSSLGPTGPTGALGVVAATSPITYDSGTQTVSIDQASISIDNTQVGLTLKNVTAAYAMLADDSGKYIRVDSASLVNFTVNNVFSPGESVDVYQKGAGVVKFIAGSGVTLEGAGVSAPIGGLSILSRYSAATIICDSAGVYSILGNVGE